MRKSKVYSISDEDFKDLVLSSSSYSDCLRALGLSPKGRSSTDVLKQRISELNCSTNHFKRDSNVKIREIIPLELILIENSTYTNTSRLKKRLVEAKLLENKCSKCGCLPEWNGLPLVLLLDHINGNHSDNRLINLRMLCPNCHSLTSTYSGKNMSKSIKRCIKCGCCITLKAILCKKCSNEERSYQLRKVDRPSKEDLLEELQSCTMVEVGKHYNVSDNAVRKWLKFYSLPTSIRVLKLKGFI